MGIPELRTPGPRQRCAGFEVDAGRCQLLERHANRHAAQVSDAVMTWDDNEVHLWPREHDLTRWLVNLAWAPGFPRTERRAQLSR
jgi:hypothetical protein